MMNTQALQQGPLCGLYQHRTALSSRFGNWPICQHPLNAGNLRLRGVFHQYKDRWVLAQAQPTQASKVLPVRTKTALRKMPKAELEEEMRQLSLDTKGTKQELVDRLHAYLAAQEAEGGPKDDPVADKSPSAPEGWPFEAEAEAADLPPDIKALLKLQAEREQMGGMQEGGREELEPESSMIFGASDSPEDLQALPKRELQEKLAQRGLPKTGNKAELAQRLHAALAEEQEMVLQDQMEARDELQRQFQESMMNSSRMEAEEQEEDPVDAASGIPEDSYDQWAMDIEAEFQSPDDDAELSLEDAEAAGATPGAVRDEEGGVLRGRFNRPHAMMDLFEYQGTKAAELAGEDYAAQRRGGAEHNQDSSSSQQRMATPVDSQDEGDLFHISMADGDAEDGDDDGYENDIENDLEDGFSMAAEEEGDDFDPDMEEENVREAEARSMPPSLQASTSEYIGHRNYNKLSSRSPDDIEEELGLLDTIISAPSTDALPDGQLELDSASSSNVQSISALMNSPLNLSRRVPKPQGVKPGQAPAVVASQGTSSLDFGTAKDWMSTRLPEAMRLGITPDQLVSEAAPPQSQAASADAASDSTSALSRGSSEASDRSSRDSSGLTEDASSQSKAIEEQQVTEPQLKEELADTEGAPAESMAYHLDSDLLDELAEDVLGQPGASPEDAAPAQPTSTVSAVQQELDGAEALISEGPDGRGESSEAECVSVLDASDTSPPAEHGVQAEREVTEIPAATPDSASTEEEAAAASAAEAALPLPNTSNVLAAEGPETVPAQGDQGMVGSSAGQTADEQEREADQLPAQHSSEDIASTAPDTAPGNSEGMGDPIRPETDAPSLSAVTESETSSAAAPQVHDAITRSEQLEQVSDEDSSAMAPRSVSASHSAPPDVPSESQDTMPADDELTGNHQQDLVVPDTAEPTDDRSADLLNGSAEAQSGDPHKEGQAALAKDQQELAALRVEMAQKQGALAALQSQVAAVGRSNEGNTAQIAQLQVAMASLQSQRLDLQRANLSGRLAVLQDVAAQASLNIAAKEDLQEQLQSMRDELTQLEADLSSRDTEAADLSRKLAHARTKLGDPTAAPPANGHARASQPAGMRARLGKNDDIMVGGQHTLEQDGAPPQQSAQEAPDKQQSGTESPKKSTTQPGVVVAAGLLGAFKAIGGMFKRTKRDEQN